MQHAPRSFLRVGVIAAMVALALDQASKVWLLSVFGIASRGAVHLTTFPTDLERYQDDALAKKWDKVRAVRRVVTGALEIERAAKRIGSSLEASPVIYVADRALPALLADIDLAEVCITSNCEVQEGAAPDGAFTLSEVQGVAVVVERAVGTKCARSWRILPDVGADPEYPEVSPRDAKALREWDAARAAAE